MILASQGINWTWYLECELLDEGVIIQRHYRLHHYRDFDHPTPQGGYRIIESEGRIANTVEIYIGDKVQIYKVSNPRYIFNYK